MSTINDIRKAVGESTPVLALVGATDAAMQSVRHLIANPSTVQTEVETRATKLQEQVEKVVADFDARQLQARVAQRLDRRSLQVAAQQAPALAVSRALEIAGRAEAGYESLAERGKVVVARVRTRKATQDQAGQGKVSISRTRAAVANARKAVDETATAALGMVRAARGEAGADASTAAAVVKESVAVAEDLGGAATTARRAAPKRVTTRSRTATSTSRSAGKGPGTSARKTVAGATRTATGVDKNATGVDKDATGVDKDDPDRRDQN